MVRFGFRMFFPRPKSELQDFIFLVLGSAIWAFIIIGAIYLVTYLLVGQLIEWSLIVSLWVAEVPIGVFLWALLGERGHSARRRAIDAIEKAKAIEEYEHLEVHLHNEWDDFAYPALYYFIVNTSNKHAYFAPDYIHDLEVGRIVYAQRYESDEELDAFFKKEGILLEKREARPSELKKHVPIKGLSS